MRTFQGKGKRDKKKKRHNLVSFPYMAVCDKFSVPPPSDERLQSDGWSSSSLLREEEEWWSAAQLEKEECWARRQSRSTESHRGDARRCTGISRWLQTDENCYASKSWLERRKNQEGTQFEHVYQSEAGQEDVHGRGEQTSAIASATGGRQGNLTWGMMSLTYKASCGQRPWSGTLCAATKRRCSG